MRKVWRAALLGTILLTIWYYRKDLAQFDISLKERLARNLSLAPVVEVPYKQGLALIVVTICTISMHHPLENWLGVGKNSVLLIAPLVCSGVVMILRHDRARHYVEREVDWWTLLFFMLLFCGIAIGLELWSFSAGKENLLVGILVFIIL